jgi:hypothetical protein
LDEASILACSKEGEVSVRRYPTIKMIIETIEKAPIQKGRFTQIDLVVEPFKFFFARDQSQNGSHISSPFPQGNFQRRYPWKNASNFFSLPNIIL